MRGHGSGAHPRRIPDRNLQRCDGAAAAPLRPCGRGVLRALRLPAVAGPRRRGPRTAAPPTDRSLSAVAAGAHHARLPGRRHRHPDPAARGQPRQPDGVAGQPHPDAGLCPADPDRRADPDVEPVGRGELLPGAADPGLAGPRASGACPPPGDRRGGAGQPGLGSAADPHTAGRQLPQLAAGLRVVVRRGHAAGRMDRQSAELGAQAGPQPLGRRRRRPGGLS